MNVRVLHTADWHLGKSLEGRSRLPEQEAVLQEIIDITKREAIDVVLIAGDIYDSVNPPAQAEQLYYQTLAELADGGKRQIIVTAGNHDHPDRLTAAAPLSARQGIHFVRTIPDAPLTIHLEHLPYALQLACIPYPSEARLQHILSDSILEEDMQLEYHQKVKDVFHFLTQSLDPKHVLLGMSHLFVAGGATSESERPIHIGGAYTVHTSAFPEILQYTALGHLHRPQTLRKESVSPIRYSGSPLAYSFSEAGQTKSITILDVKPQEKAHYEELYLSSGRPLVKWKAESVQEVHHWLEEGRDSRAWIELEVEVDHALTPEAIHKLRQAHDGLITIRPLYKSEHTQESIQGQASLPIEELFIRYYKQQTGGAIPDQGVLRLFAELTGQEELDQEHPTPAVRETGERLEEQV